MADPMIEADLQASEIAAGWRYIYGPAHAVKGLSNGQHASEQMQPYIRIWTPHRPASRKLMMSDSEPHAYIRPLLGERPPGPDVMRSLSPQRPDGIGVPRI